MARKHPATRPKPTAASATPLLTRRVRKLIDLAYGGNVRLASMTTGLPYATLRDLYTGRTLNPGIATLQLLADRHGFSEQWFLTTRQAGVLPPLVHRLRRMAAQSCVPGTVRVPGLPTSHQVAANPRRGDGGRGDVPTTGTLPVRPFAGRRGAWRASHAYRNLGQREVAR